MAAEEEARDGRAWSRRRVLGAGAGVAAAGLVGGLGRAADAALAGRAAEPESDDGRAATAEPSFELAEATLADLGAALAAGRTTSRALCERYLERIDRLDRRGPTLRAVLEVNPDLLAQADAADRARAAGEVRGPLHGIPVLLKDNIATGDRMLSSAGSLALPNPAPRDAFLVARLRAGGALLLGKANLSEWANFRSTHSSSGWSARGGQCRNPYALDRSPSGSSSGSAAAVAANLAPVAVGSETDGSIVSPCAACGLVGVKPTLGLVPRTGVVPIAHSQDTAGPMARTVADAALLLAAMAGEDPLDAPSTGAAAARARGERPSLDPGALRGVRLGVMRERYFGYSPATDALVEESLRALRDAGAVLVDPANLATARAIDAPELEVLLYEFKADLEKYFAGLGDTTSLRTLRDLLAFNERERAREMPYFGQEIVAQAAAKGPLTDAGYRKALAACRDAARTRGLDALFAKHRLDAVVAPTQGPAWLIDLVNGDSVPGGSSTPAAVAGYPSVTVPAGLVRGLPIGLSFVGPAWSDFRLLGYAYAFEQATKARRPPGFAATVPVER